MIKVLHICNLSLNGKAVFLSNLLRRFDYSKYDVTILNYGGQSSQIIMDRLAGLPIEIVSPSTASKREFMTLLKKYLREKKVDVIHSHMWDLSGFFLFEAYRAGVPVRVAHSHNTSKVKGRYNVAKETFRDRIVWPVAKKMIERYGNRYAACSYEAVEWLFTKKIISSRSYEIVYNGIDYSVYNADAITRKPDRVEVLFAGRLVYQKNPLFAVRAFAEFRKRNDKAHLTIIGRGNLGKEVREEIDRSGIHDHVTWIEETNEMKKYYSDSHIVLAPANYEALSLVLIEAQACGAMVLVSENVPYEMAQCGLIDHLELSAGPEGWAQKMEEMLTRTDVHADPQQLSRFSLEHTVEQIEELYSKDYAPKDRAGSRR